MGLIRKNPFLALTLVAVLLIWLTPLSLFPIPWPDDSVFYLAGQEWIHLPPQFRMHSQAAFIPSYDSANFNNMPALPTLMGVASLLGVSTTHLARLFGILIFGLWAFALVKWLQRLNPEQKSQAIFYGVGLAALTSPVLRWGPVPIHPEIWQGLLWLFILQALAGNIPKFFKGSLLWALAVYLGVAASFHFQAIVWVIPTAVGLYPFGEERDYEEKLRLWFQRLIGVTWRTLVVLSPWILYVVFHWSEFWTQMDLQFGRLDEGGHPFISSLKTFFHSFFVETGNPAKFPKFYNAGKIIFFLLCSYALIENSVRLLKKDRLSSVRWAALLAVVTTTYLWVSKPETWFVTLIHASLLPALALSFSPLPGKLARKVLGLGLTALIAIQIGVAFHQLKRAQKREVTWANYTHWVACVEEAIGPRTKIWVPTSLDPLVDLAGRRPRLDYTRHSDFPDPVLARALVDRIEAILHSKLIPDHEAPASYQGGLRPLDFTLVTDDPYLEYKEFFAHRLGEPWKARVCQEGPFWGVISFR